MGQSVIPDISGFTPNAPASVPDVLPPTSDGSEISIEQEQQASANAPFLPERRIQRPKDQDEQKSYYSSKKKSHTVKKES